MAVWYYIPTKEEFIKEYGWWSYMRLSRKNKRLLKERSQEVQRLERLRKTNFTKWLMS